MCVRAWFLFFIIFFIAHSLFSFFPGLIFPHISFVAVFCWISFTFQRIPITAIYTIHIHNIKYKYTEHAWTTYTEIKCVHFCACVCVWTSASARYMYFHQKLTKSFNFQTELNFNNSNRISAMEEKNSYYTRTNSFKRKRKTWNVMMV